MKYYTAIITLIFFNIAAIVSLLYFGNGSSLIKEKNKKILIEINNEKERLKINELEYSLYTNYNYLEKIHKIYFDNNKSSLKVENRISINDLKNRKNFNIFKVSSNN